MKRRYSFIKLLVASLGVILVIGGLATVILPVADARTAVGWVNRSVLDFLTGAWMDAMYLGHLADWLRRPDVLAFVQKPIAYLLDLIPLWLALIGAGGLMVWRALR